MTDCGCRRRRLKRDVVSKILVRQLVGDRKLHRLFGVEPSSRPFHKLPARLCFQLSSLVDEIQLLAEGHVFLGFLKDGNFIVSYTHLVGPEEGIGVSGHSYYLHWWLFVPYRKLEKVGSVRLFGDKAITSDDVMSLTVSQWPHDQTKLVVCGVDCRRNDYEQRTYITIAFNPLLSCYFNRSSQGLDGCCNRCCNALHYFNCHMPVYPRFVPSILMKLDGVCVINDGDSLISLAVTSAHVSGSPSAQPFFFALDWSSAIHPVESRIRLVEAEYSPIDSPAYDRPALTYGLGMLGVSSPRVFAANSAGKPLHSRRKGGVTAKLLMLNVESYFASDLISTDERSLVDFDMTILDVCEASYKVIAQLIVLYRLKKVQVVRMSIKKSERWPNYEFTDLVKKRISFSWSLMNGTVTRLGISDYSEASDCLKSRPLQLEDQLLLHRRLGVPLSPTSQTVVTMSNQPVLNGKSLKLLVDPYNYVTIVL